MTVVVRVQQADIDVGAELDAMRAGKPSVGAIASFIGTVRDLNEVGGTRASVASLTLEHYPGMTERSLAEIGEKACARWPLVDVTIVHRIGTLQPTDRIVFVATSSSHREAAFEACAFVMDFLKTDAPFWKKESTPTGSRWVEARDIDRDAAGRWTAEA